LLEEVHAHLARRPEGLKGWPRTAQRSATTPRAAPVHLPRGLRGAVLCLLAHAATAATAHTQSSRVRARPAPLLRPPGTRPILANRAAEGVRRRGLGRGARALRAGLAGDGVEAGGEAEREGAMSASDYAQLFGTAVGHDVVAPTLKPAEHTGQYDTLFGGSVTEGGAEADADAPSTLCGCLPRVVFSVSATTTGSRARHARPGGDASQQATVACSAGGGGDSGGEDMAVDEAAGAASIHEQMALLGLPSSFGLGGGRGSKRKKQRKAAHGQGAAHGGAGEEGLLSGGGGSANSDAEVEAGGGGRAGAEAGQKGAQGGQGARTTVYRRGCWVEHPVLQTRIASSVCTHGHTHVQTRAHECMYTCLQCVHARAHTRPNTRTHTHSCTHACMRAHTLAQRTLSRALARTHTLTSTRTYTLACTRVHTYALSHTKHDTPYATCHRYANLNRPLLPYK